MSPYLVELKYFFEVKTPQLFVPFKCKDSKNYTIAITTVVNNSTTNATPRYSSLNFFESPRVVGEPETLIDAEYNLCQS